jgi:cAMP-dependent protein kinase regulator
MMAESNFPGVAGVSSNPFSPAGSVGSTSGAMHKVLEEEEGDPKTSPAATAAGRRLAADDEDDGSPSRGAPFRHQIVVDGSEDATGPGSGGDDAAAAAAAAAGGRFSDDGRHLQQPLSAARATLSVSDGFPSDYALGRRTSVSAESMNPTASMSDNWSPPVHPKTDEQLRRLQTAVAGNFLFAHLDDEQTAQVLGALVEKPIPAKDIKVIAQGDVGDYFYVVERGQFDVYVNAAGTCQPGPAGMGKRVGSIGPGGSFGELALMYNAPRAATVLSTEPASCLWALDRLTFRRILMDSTFARRRMYESFLEEVPLLASLTPYERAKIADALDTQKFAPGATIIREGDPGEAFYILESGEAEVYKRGVDGPVTEYGKGDYFGELALLNDAPRAASVVSKTEVKVATLGKDAFQRLLGPVEGIMRRDDPSKRSRPQTAAGNGERAAGGGGC